MGAPEQSSSKISALAQDINSKFGKILEINKKNLDIINIDQINNAIKKYNIDTIYHLGSILSAIKIMSKLEKQRQNLRKNSLFFRRSLKHIGFNIGNSQTHIVPIIIGEPNKTILISNKLENKGLYLAPIRPPSVPSNSSRLRISVSSLHKLNHLNTLIKELKNLSHEF